MIDVEFNYSMRAEPQPKADSDDAARGGAYDQIEVIDDGCVEVIFNRR